MKYEITDEEVIKAWGNANFGIPLNPEQKKNFIRNAVMKKAMGYHCGHTITQIMKELGLINKSELPSKKGRTFLQGLHDKLEYHP